MEHNHEDELAELLAEVRRIEAQSRRLVADITAGGYNSVFRGSGIEFDEVRDYVVGDDPRTIDWNVTARVGRPYVKKYVDEREQTMMFLLDISPSMSGAFGIWSARQTAARIVGCMALAAERNNDKIGLAAFSEGVDRYVPAQKGSGHALRIIRDCLALPAGKGVTNLVPALEIASQVLRRHAIVFLVSDFQSRGWQEALTLCGKRHDVIAVRILPPELSTPMTGLMRLHDPETGRQTLVDWGHPQTRQAWADRVAAWDEQTQELLRRAGVDLMDVPIPMTPDRDAIARPIHKFFRMRAKRGAKE